MTPQVLHAAGVFAAAGLAATAVAGGWPYLVAVLTSAVVALVGLQGGLAAAGERPVLLAAAVAGVGTPLWAFADPGAQLGRLPLLTAATLLLAFVLLFAGPRRRGVTLAVGATTLAGTLVGLGAGALVLLSGPDAGTPWAVTLVALVLVGEIAAWAAARSGRAEVAGPARYVSYGVVAGGAVGLFAPVSVPAAAVLVAGVVAATLAAGALAARLSPDRSAAGLAPVAPRWLVTTLLAAPVTLLTALAVQT